MSNLKQQGSDGEGDALNNDEMNIDDLDVELIDSDLSSLEDASDENNEAPLENEAIDLSNHNEVPMRRANRGDVIDLQEFMHIEDFDVEVIEPTLPIPVELIVLQPPTENEASNNNPIVNVGNYEQPGQENRDVQPLPAPLPSINDGAVSRSNGPTTSDGPSTSGSSSTPPVAPIISERQSTSTERSSSDGISSSTGPSTSTRSTSPERNLQNMNNEKAESSGLPIKQVATSVSQAGSSGCNQPPVFIRQQTAIRSVTPKFHRRTYVSLGKIMTPERVLQSCQMAISASSSVENMAVEETDNNNIDHDDNDNGNGENNGNEAGGSKRQQSDDEKESSNKKRKTSE